MSVRACTLAVHAIRHRCSTFDMGSLARACSSVEQSSADIRIRALRSPRLCTLTAALWLPLCRITACMSCQRALLSMRSDFVCSAVGVGPPQAHIESAHAALWMLSSLWQWRFLGFPLPQVCCAHLGDAAVIACQLAAVSSGSWAQYGCWHLVWLNVGEVVCGSTLCQFTSAQVLPAWSAHSGGSHAP